MLVGLDRFERPPERCEAANQTAVNAYGQRRGVQGCTVPFDGIVGLSGSFQGLAMNPNYPLVPPLGLSPQGAGPGGILSRKKFSAIMIGSPCRCRGEAVRTVLFKSGATRRERIDIQPYDLPVQTQVSEFQ